MKRTYKCLICVLAVVGAGHSQAQTSTCRDNTGRIYQSLRPCPSGLIYYGPTERQSAGSGQYTPSIGQAPEHITLMSPRCASLHDAMRTAAARGIKQTDMADMRREYSRDCGEDELKARNQLMESRTDKRNAVRSAEESQQQAVARSRLSAEMCGELKRVIKNKKMRTDLTPGEVGDLERSEQNYKNRCT